jgi:hypothetical protein
MATGLRHAAKMREIMQDLAGCGTSKIRILPYCFLSADNEPGNGSFA